MRLHLKPYWIFISVTIPQLVLFWVFYKVFNIIGSQLDNNSIKAWTAFGSALGVIWLGATLYGIFCTVGKREIKPFLGLGLMALYTAFLYVYLLNSRAMIPWTIPRWMLSGLNAEILVVTLIMPALAYSMLLTVSWLTPGDKQYTLWKELIAAVSIPLVWYLGVNVLLPLFRNPIDFISPHVIVILLIASTACFLFFITRLVLLLLMKKPILWKYIRIPIVAVFPTLGLLVNNGLVNIMPFKHSFGDFSHALFYVFALITGALLLLPEIKNTHIRLALFFAKAVMVVYTFYFFIVFLPFLPLSVMAVIAAGLGFLMLTPLVLLLVHVKSLWIDIQYLRGFLGRYRVLALLLAGLAVLPAGVILNYSRDAANLDTALKYVYEPDYRDISDTKIDIEGVKRTLENVKTNRKRDGFDRFLTADATPYLTSVYNWLVLDNLTLSDSKVKMLEQVFFGQQKKSTGIQPVETGENPIKINSFKTETSYDEEGGFYRSWVHFELLNQVERQGEYSTNFLLPPGSWITDYYLYVGEQQKFGILADKRAATWVYQQIVNERKDPGILHYLSGNKIAFKVFPFGAGELRKTGFEIIHKEPVQLIVDDQRIDLNGSVDRDDGETEVIHTPDGSAAYIPVKVKEHLPKVNRKPYYHFIVDFSKAGKNTPEEKYDRIQSLLDKNLLDSSGTVITAANYKTKTVEMADGWKSELKKLPAEGGFFLERAMKKVIAGSYQSGSSRYPIIIVVSDDFDNAIMSDTFADMKFAFPETNFYYELNTKGQLYSHSLTSRDKEASVLITDGFPERGVRAWPDAEKPSAFLSDDEEASVVLLKEGQLVTKARLKESLWESGLYLEATHKNLALNPYKYGDLNLHIIENSFKTKIMTPLTSYIVVENEAQEKVLLEKQKQILSTKKQLDLGGATQMSEPSLWMLLIPLIGIAVLKRVKSYRGV
jgi:hypothetical protein